MHESELGLSLTFASLKIGKNETPRDLTRLLYIRGASIRADQVADAIKTKSLGEICPDRLKLVRNIHEYINGQLVSGGSQATARGQINAIEAFFRWADSSGSIVSTSEVVKSFLAFTEYLLHRVNVVGDMQLIGAYNYAKSIGQVLDGALERDKPMVKLSRIVRPRSRKSPQGAVAEKQRLDHTFAFGRVIQDICDGTTLASISGDRPEVRITLQQGGYIKITRGRQALPEEQRLNGNINRSIRRALSYKKDTSLGHVFKRQMINLRVQAELLMFIGQTGMNLAQAKGLHIRQLSYAAEIGGYKVRDYKSRRSGEVLFEIFSEYRSHFERYLGWRREIYPNEDVLFPFIRHRGTRDDAPLTFDAVKSVCKKAGVVWISPTRLRGTRVNWLLRRSGDPDLTAEMAQHSKQTLLTSYEVPSLQRTMNEITRFHQIHDPAMAGHSLMPAVAEGECNGVPFPLDSKPRFALLPDCKLPSGCLWCEHHRDIDSFEYVWSMASFRYLKIMELSMDSPSNLKEKRPHPAESVIERLSEKLSWFRDSSKTRCEWVEEALARIEEGVYQDRWNHIIMAVESRSKCK